MSSARVLFYSLMPRIVGYSRKITILVGGKEVGRPSRLAIGESLRKKEFCLFHCDAKWNHLAGGFFNTITDAKKEAEVMYPGVTATWVKTDVSKREAKKIEREYWRGYECSLSAEEFHSILS